MASDQEIARCIVRLEAAGCKRPDGPAEALVEVWRAVMAHLSDRELATATRVYLEGMAEPWWPMPARIRACHVPAPRPQLEAATSAWVELVPMAGGWDLRGADGLSLYADVVRLGWVRLPVDAEEIRHTVIDVLVPSLQHSARHGRPEERDRAERELEHLREIVRRLPSPVREVA